MHPERGVIGGGGKTAISRYIEGEVKCPYESMFARTVKQSTRF
jgi:hypothetical protein